MVQFTKLRLTGFKSFVESTELAIEPGVTGIVGPNGCGKSNLLEAMRWCMGEGSAKQLRGGGMDDVIFAGTSRRPSRNIAEVAIVLSNQEKQAPGDYNHYDELEIVRRIEREAGSAYRINGKDQRARDVQTLFADLSTGARSNAIVSQGQVGQIMSAKPAERRLLLEEAAGITGLHSRRHEAELRLRAAETNLERLEDVIGAITGQLQGLKRQARQATRYRNVNEAIRKTEAMVLHLRWRTAEGDLEKAREALRDIARQVDELSAEAARISSRQAEAAAEMPSLRDAEREAAAALQRLTSAKDGLDAEAAQIAERQQDAETRLAQIDADTAREEQFVSDARDALARLDAEQAQLEEAQAGNADDEAAASEAVEKARAAVDGLDGEVTELTERVAARQARRETLERRVAEAEARLARLNERAAEVAGERSKLEAEHKNGERDLFLEAAKRAVAEAETALEQAQAEAEAAEAKRTETQESEAEEREALRVAEETLSALRAEEAGLARILDNGGEGGDFAPVVDGIAVQPGYEAALGAALGEDLQAALDSKAPKHWGGRTASEDGPSLPEGCTPLASVVDAPAPLARRLSQIGVVEDAAAAERLSGALRQGQRLVGRDGGLWRWDGYVSAPGAPDAAAVRLQQDNRLRELRGEIESAEAELAAVRARHEERRETLSAAQAAEKEAVEKVRGAFAELDAAREEKSRRAEEVASQNSKLASLRENEERIAADIAEAEDALSAAREELEGIAEDAEETAALGEKRAALAEAREELGRCQQEYNALAAARQSRQDRLRAIVDERQAWERRIANGESQLAQLTDRRERTKAEIEQLSARPAEIEEKRGALLSAIEEAEEKRNAAADTLAEKESALAAIDRQLKDTEKRLADARESRGRAEGAVSQAEQSLAAIVERIRERLNCAPEKAVELAEMKEDEDLPPIEEIEAKLEKLTRERDNIGPVNLRAEQEAKELEEQIATYETEREDLIKAIDKLRRGIANLNREGRERLLASFEVVNDHFQELFGRLFQGGKARLELVDSDDPLEAGLEIMASPSGKNLQRLSLLSGGEKALAALALIFAVFLTNPAPICVLDEVDAPLDQTNVGRFCDLVEEIAATTDTRFLIVTHNSITMARVDRLYGVTMAEEGVSQLVSVNLREAEALRETA